MMLNSQPVKQGAWSGLSCSLYLRGLMYPVDVKHVFSFFVGVILMILIPGFTALK